MTRHLSCPVTQQAGCHCKPWHTRTALQAQHGPDAGRERASDVIRGSSRGKNMCGRSLWPQMHGTPLGGRGRAPQTAARAEQRRRCRWRHSLCPLVGEVAVHCALRACSHRAQVPSGNQEFGQAHPSARRLFMSAPGHPNPNSLACALPLASLPRRPAELLTRSPVRGKTVIIRNGTYIRL